MDLGRLANEIMADLKPMHEEWSSTKLAGVERLRVEDLSAGEHLDHAYR